MANFMEKDVLSSPESITDSGKSHWTTCQHSILNVSIASHYNLYFPQQGKRCLSLGITVSYSDYVRILVLFHFRLDSCGFGLLLYGQFGGGTPLCGRYLCKGSQWPHPARLHLGVTGAWLSLM
eukprot:gene5647-10877_t